MSKADKIITKLYTDIIENGETRPETRMFWKDGTPAYYRSVFGKQIIFKPEDGFPILTKKFVPFKSLSQEILWIWQKQSNVVQDLRDMGSHVWDEWETEDGTIQKAYGWQLANNFYDVAEEHISDEAKYKINFDKIVNHRGFWRDGKAYISLNQVEYVIQQLIDNPYSRQILTTLWKVSDLSEMSLQPCVYETQWILINNKVDLIVRVRSNDEMLGAPYNIAQYSLLQRLICQVTNRNVGNLIFQLGDCHIYDRHIELIEQFIDNEEFDAPELWIDSNVDKFEDFKFGENFKLINYKNGIGNAGALKTEVCVTKKELDRLNK